MFSKQGNGIYYFIGNITSHVIHALPLYNRIGGTFIVTSQKSVQTLVYYKVPVICIDDVPYIWRKGHIKPIRQYEYTKLDHRHQLTVDFLNHNATVVIYYELFEFADGLELTKPKKIFLTHGNMLKDYIKMYPKRLKLIQTQYDYMAALGPYMKKQFILNGVPKEKLINIGIARSDEIIKLKRKIIISPRLKKLGISRNKPVISYLPTFWGDSSVESLGIKITKFISHDYELLVRLHPQTPNKIIKKYRNMYSDNVHLFHEGDKYAVGLLDILGASSVIIGDLSSVMLEALILEKPLIFVDTDTSGNSMENSQLDEIRNYSLKLTTNNIQNLNNIISKSIERGIDPALWSKAKKRCFYNPDGDSIGSIAKFIESLLI